MIHPYALILGALLTASAALGGHIPSALLLVYVVLVRKPRARVPPPVLGIIIIFSVLQLLSTLIINLIVSSSPAARDAIYGKNFRLLVESLGIYELSGGSGIIAGACVPTALLLLYVCSAWRFLTRPFRIRHIRPLWTTVVWAFVSIAAALVAPTVPATVPLLIGMAVLSCVALGEDSLLFHMPRRAGGWRGDVPRLALYASALCGTLLGCLILAATCIAQNVFVASALRGVDAMFGLARIYDLPINIAVCRVLQVCAMTIALFLAQMTLECFVEYRRGYSDRANTPFLSRGTAAQRLPNRRSTRLSLSSTNPVVSNLCERIVNLSWRAAQYSISAVRSGSRLGPLALMAAHMTAFPSLASLCLLPSMMAGQLIHYAEFSRLLRPSLVLAGTGVMAQYIVLATKSALPHVVRRLFLSDFGIEWEEVLQVACGEVIFLVLLAADVALRSHLRAKQLQQQQQQQQEEDEPAGEEYNEDAECNSPGKRAHFRQGNPADTDNNSNNNNNNILTAAHVSDEPNAESPMGLDAVVMCAEHVLGAQRVRELLRLVADDSGEGMQYEVLFARLTGRPPTAIEDRRLPKHEIAEALLLDKMRSARELLIVHYVHWIGVLFMRHAVLVALLLLFVVGSFTYHMDVIHVIALLLFGIYFFIPGVIDERWLPVVFYVMLLTSFKLVFTFASQFFTLPVYIPGTPVQWETIGFVPLRARYELIPYVVAVFGLSLLYLNGRACRTWGKVVSQYEWDRFTRSAPVRQWSMRITMTIATTVFVAFGVFLSRSLIVEGFLALFLILTIASTLCGLSGALLRTLWFIACVYSGIIVLATTVCQFSQMEEQVRHIVDRIPGCAGTTICQEEIGLYPTDRSILVTFFLAPWFLAFATAATHLAANCAASDDDTVWLNGRRNDYDLVNDNNNIPGDDHEGEGEFNNRKDGGSNSNSNKNTRRFGHRATSVSNVRESFGDARRIHDTDNDDDDGMNNIVFIKGSENSNNNHSKNGNDRDRKSSKTRETVSEHNWGNSMLSLYSNDQRFPRHVAVLLGALDRLGGWLASFGADYGCVVVWVALLLAAMRRPTLMSAVYMAFFLLDLTHITVLIYCVLHILVLYTYNFSFIPAVQYTLRGVSLGALVGLEKDNTEVPFNQVIGPVLVFFAVCLRIQTRGANKATRSRQRTEGPESSNWRSVVCTQLFYYVGFEAFVLALLITEAVGGSDSCSGAAAGVALLIALLAQRQRFHYARVSFPLLFIVSAMLAWEYAMQLNDTHTVFPEIPAAIARDDDMWSRWVFMHRTATLVGAFFGVMLLHTNRQQACDTAVNFAVLRSQFGGYTSLIELVRCAGVPPLQRLSEERFDRVVPRVVETSPRSFLGRITTCVIFTMSCTYPLPILSFSAGVASEPCLINLVLILCGLLHVARFEAAQWNFFRFWPLIEMLYYVFVCLPPLCGAPFLRQFLLHQVRFSEVLGLVRGGHTYWLTPWHVALLFFVAVQARVYHDFRYEKILRKLYHATADQHSKHEALWGWLVAKCVQEKKLAVEHNRALHQKLNEIRQTSHIVDDTLLPKNILPLEVPLPSKTGTRVPTRAKPTTAKKPAPKAEKKPQLKPVASDGGDGDQGEGFVRDTEKSKESHKLPIRLSESGEMPNKQGDTPTRPGRFRRFLRSINRSIRKGVVKLCDWMTLHTYEPRKHKASEHRNLYVHLFLTFIRVVKRHTEMIAFIATLVSFLMTQTIWEMFPFLYILVFANVYNPFSPRFVYRLLSIYLVVGIVIKAIISVTIVQITPSDKLLRVLSWLILHVENGKYDTKHIGYSYIMTDFIVYAVIVIHRDISLTNGVYSRQDILCYRERDGATNQTEEHQLSIENSDEVDDAFPDFPRPSSPGNEASRLQAHASVQIPIREHALESGEKVESGTSVDKCNERFVPLEGLCIADLGEERQNAERQQQVDAQIRMEEDCFGVSQRALSMDSKLSHIWGDFIRNATTIAGVGRDWYVYGIVVEAVALLVFAFGYSEMSGGSDDTLQEGLQQNLLPGPMVLIVFTTLIVLIADRMLYVTQSMLGKLILNTLSGVVYCVCYFVWGNLVKVPSRTMGNVFFVLKVFALTISVLQLRVGYPLHRRHDPFTTIKNPSMLRHSCYMIYRAIPFLWELRTIIDWTVERTALRLGNYFKVEDIYDIVYGRRIEIDWIKYEQPVPGTPVRLFAKIRQGLLYMGIIVLVLIVPLAYYSTFNPSMISNDVSQLRDTVSIMSLRFFSSITYSSTPLPNDWRVWLTRTRPSLKNFGFDTTKVLQLMSLNSCSNELWPISPQAFRQLKEELTNVAEGNTTMDMFHTLEITRGTSGESFPTFTHSWNIPPTTARELLELLNFEVFNESKFVLLKNFYSPFVLNRANGIGMYFSEKNTNTMDCSVQLRREEDVILQTTVRYWCIKCQSLFTSGNIPTDNKVLYPEWDCLSQGVGCSDYNFETHDDNVSHYNSVPMYFVALSDPIAGGVPFLQGLGIIALYTTFVLAIGRFFRGIFSDHAKNVILYDMADPTPVGQLLEYIAIARECGELRLEQSVYFELIDLLRSPEKLLRLTGFNKRVYDTENQTRTPPSPPQPASADSVAPLAAISKTEDGAVEGGRLKGE